ncbi:hypothetical protein MAPG_10056 [Magnaporthiopsis poae ATCC 64411]|uniref:Uncharacterized protein n=1 Tax=Magnaporthiopsis poae (strain ATCC 64411 / 73-15) TaxID=644358 RepID=A0A0C4EBK4_MAGP6|nr:hypothetical protein MAPG_10056 [Magnaporthiopsis poae ATCC 64411]
MPPKRSAPAQASSARGRKSRKSDQGQAQPAEDAAGGGASSDGEDSPVDPDAFRASVLKAAAKTRYTPYSSSSNLEGEYLVKTQDKAKAYGYVCLCHSPFKKPRDEDEEDEDGDEAEGQDDQGDDGKDCDGGKTCLCLKPAADHPDHPWVIMYAGQLRFRNYWVQTDLRCPDNFGMYTFNDHEGYGWVQVFQNALLDYEEAGKAKNYNWKEQWAVCSGIGKLAKSAMDSPMGMIDDGDGLRVLVMTVGAMFLDMLYTLEREGQLSATSEVKDLGITIAMFVEFAGAMRDAGALETDCVQMSSTSTSPSFFLADPTFDEIAQGYARKYSVAIPQGGGVAAVLDGIEPLPEDKLPQAGANKSPWKFDTRLRNYKREQGGVAALHRRTAKTTIGGDWLDITSWKPADRKKAAFDGKDPLTKEAINALKRGDVLQLA